MKRFGMFVAKNRIAILIVAVLLLIPSFYGMARTRINYDILTYLPQRLDSMKAQNIVDKTFKSAALSMLIVENMDTKDIIDLKSKIAKIDDVEKVIWADDLVDPSVPGNVLPDDIRSLFYSKNSTLMIIKFKESASSDKTQNAIANIRKVMNKQCFLSGMSAIVKDTKDLADKETPFYVLIAVIFSVILLSLTMESVIIPFIFLAGIGLAILYNFGTNIFLGQISYITKALVAALQLGVTMDFSIFLLHRYEEERKKYDNKLEAMAEAISKTIAAIGGSAATAIAGFLAMCAMQLGLGFDIGIVMAKGVFLGVLSTATILPSLILVFDKPIHKYCHKTLLPSFKGTARLVTGKYNKVLILIFILALLPAIYGKQNTKVYYNLDESLPKKLDSIVATNKLKDDYKMTTTHMIVVKNALPSYKVRNMVESIEKVDGVDKVLAYDKFLGPGIPKSFIPDDLKSTFEKGKYKLIIVNSKYKAARNEENEQIKQIISIVKSYDKSGVVGGEGPLTKDLIEIADKDFKSVDMISIIAIFAIILLLFSSLSIPILLVGSIELAIFINMAIPCYTGKVIPFVASIVIGCIQLGSTVNYAILLTTRYREELRSGLSKNIAMKVSVENSSRAIITSGLSFFAATSGVALISKIEMISTLCLMLARGAIISMFVIVYLLPCLLTAFERVIEYTSLNWKREPQLIKKLLEKTSA